MREGKARRFASVRVIFLGYHPATPETVVPGAIMTYLGQGLGRPSDSAVFAQRGVCGGRGDGDGGVAQ
jgi:hypothetical protein